MVEYIKDSVLHNWCFGTQEHAHSLCLKCTVPPQGSMASHLAIQNICLSTGLRCHISPRCIHLTHGEVWTRIKLRGPHLKTGFSKLPRGGPCIIHVHLHSLLSPYHGFITLAAAAHRRMKKPKHTVLKCDRHGRLPKVKCTAEVTMCPALHIS